MKNRYILLISIVLIIVIRFLFSGNAFREYFFIDEYLKKSEIVKKTGLDEYFMFKIDPFASTDNYLEEKDSKTPHKNTFVYFLFIFLTITRVFIITMLLYLFSVLIGLIIFTKNANIGLLDSVVGSLRSIPSIAWIPLLSSLGLLLNIKGIFLFIATGTFPLIMSQIILGIRTCQPELIDSSRLYKLSSQEIYWKVLRQSSEKLFMQGLRYGLSIGLILMLVYEIFFESTAGIIRIMQPLSIGYSLMDSILLVGLIGIIGITIDRIPQVVLSYRNTLRLKRARKIDLLFQT